MNLIYIVCFQTNMLTFKLTFMKFNDTVIGICARVLVFLFKEVLYNRVKYAHNTMERGKELFRRARRVKKCASTLAVSLPP